MDLGFTLRNPSLAGHGGTHLSPNTQQFRDRWISTKPTSPHQVYAVNSRTARVT